MCLCVVSVGALRGQWHHLAPHRAGVTGGCEPPNVSTGNQT